MNQSSGSRFEGAIQFMGTRDGLMVVHNGLRAKRYADKVVAERSNVDFMLLGDAHANEVAFVDAKAFQGERFGRSMINPRQLALCSAYERRHFVAGFVVLLRGIDYVGFYAAHVLAAGSARRGFGRDDGIALGTLSNFALRRLWTEGRPPL